MSSPVKSGLMTDDAELERLVAGQHHDPHHVLGAHPERDSEGRDRVVIRGWRPDAIGMVILAGVQRVEMRRVHPAGLFAGTLEGPDIPDYRLETYYPGEAGEVVVAADDPYRYWPTLGPLDLHLLAEGRHEGLWRHLGAQVRVHQGASGTSFAVWAPGAQAVRVVGDFNGWDGRLHPMRVLGSSGVWEVFLPGVGPGARYKFEVLSGHGQLSLRADPFAFAAEVPPATASIVTQSRYEWQDAAWFAARATTDLLRAPVSIYECHLGSWRFTQDNGGWRPLTYREAAEVLPGYLADLGFTHVEFLPVAEHPFGGSWGYQVSAYYAPTARFGTPDDFRALVDALHAAGIGVIVDWVPAHFPKDAWALGRFDGTALYEHCDPNRGEQLDWGTYVFDFGRPEVRNFLVANALYWLEEFHIDGLRVDAVASMLYLDYSRPEGGWTPNIYGGRENLEAVQFLQEMNATAHKAAPGIVTIAEESTSWPGVTRPTNLGGLGFSMKWNMGWMHDTLDYISRDPIYRSYHHHEMTFSMLYAFSENYVLPLSHDEVVHGKGTLWGRMPGNDHMKAAGVRSLLAYQWAHPGKQLLFMGQEFGQRDEWSEERGVDWHQLAENGFSGGVARMVRDINEIYRSNPALWSQDTSPEGYSWIDANDSANNVLSFLRFRTDGSMLACVFNFSGSEHARYRLGLPQAGRWCEVLNTDATDYNGAGVGNYGAVEATEEPWHGLPASAVMVLPPLSALWLQPE